MDPNKKHTTANPNPSPKTNTSPPLTVTWNDLPPWQQDNHHIQTGYRPASNSLTRSIASLAYLHNESVNIYSHLLGSCLALLSGLYVYTSVIKPRFEAHATPQDVRVFAAFFVGAVACLAVSAGYHTLSNHSRWVAGWGNRADYLGIVLLIWGSFIPSIFYGFGGDMEMVRVYWVMITSIGVATAIVVLFPQFRTPAWRPFRAFMFVAMGLSAVVPVFHGIRVFGVEQLNAQMGLYWLVTQGFLYILGAGIYAARVPERWAPGSFDIWGSSHQIFHVLVVLAAGAHLVGLLKAFDYAHSSRGLLD